MLRNNVVEKVLRLLYRREKWLVVAAVRFLRTCIGLKDDFYNRYLVRLCPESISIDSPSYRASQAGQSCRVCAPGNCSLPGPLHVASFQPCSLGIVASAHWHQGA